MSDAVLHDVHFALRGIRRRPAFTAMVVTTFALGIIAFAIALLTSYDTLLIVAAGIVLTLPAVGRRTRQTTFWRLQE